MNKRITIKLFLIGIISASFCVIAYAAKVTNVIDGDSLVIDGVEARLIGVDAPEYSDHYRNSKNASYYGVSLAKYESYAPKSEAFVRSLVKGREVLIEYDDANVGIGHEDKYKRILVYVWVPKESFSENEFNDLISLLDSVGFDEAREGYIQLNALIISGGYGTYYRRFPTKYADEFNKLENLAKEYQRGFWD